MQRRTYLSGIISSSIAITGCTASGTTDNETPPVRKVTAVSVSGLESTDLSVEASPERSEVTPERTAEISFTISWNGTKKQRLSFGSSVPYSSPKMSTDPDNLLLVDEESSFERQNDETWVPKKGDIETGDLTLLGATLEPGQSISHTWETWANPGTTSRIETGTYTFTDSIRVGQSESVNWSLTVEIDRA